MCVKTLWLGESHHRELDSLSSFSLAPKVRWERRSPIMEHMSMLTSWIINFWTTKCAIEIPFFGNIINIWKHTNWYALSHKHTLEPLPSWSYKILHSDYCFQSLKKKNLPWTYVMFAFQSTSLDFLSEKLGNRKYMCLLHLYFMLCMNLSLNLQVDRKHSFYTKK